MWVVRKSLNVNELLSLGLVFHLLPVLSEFSSREDWHELFATLFTQQLNCVERTFNFNYYQTWPSIEDDKTENAVIWLRKLTCWPKLNSKTNQPRKPISVIATLSGELISSDQEWCRWDSALLSSGSREAAGTHEGETLMHQRPLVEAAGKLSDLP